MIEFKKNNSKAKILRTQIKTTSIKDDGVTWLSAQLFQMIEMEKNYDASL